jgi:hypothetical protein
MTHHHGTADSQTLALRRGRRRMYRVVGAISIICAFYSWRGINTNRHRAALNEQTHWIDVISLLTVTLVLLGSLLLRGHMAKIRPAGRWAPSPLAGLDPPVRREAARQLCKGTVNLSPHVAALQYLTAVRVVGGSKTASVITCAVMALAFGFAAVVGTPAIRGVMFVALAVLLLYRIPLMIWLLRGSKRFLEQYRPLDERQPPTLTGLGTQIEVYQSSPTMRREASRHSRGNGRSQP